MYHLYYRSNEDDEFELIACGDTPLSENLQQTGDLHVIVEANALSATRSLGTEPQLHLYLRAHELPEGLEWSEQTPDGSVVVGPLVGPH